MPQPTPPPFFWGETPEDQYYKSHSLHHSKSYFQTPYAKIFTQSWLPLHQPKIKAVVFMTHGYRSDSSWYFQEICIAYAKWGYAVYASDLIGHGRSEGIRGYVGDMDKAAGCALAYYGNVRRSEEYRKLPAFLFGQSMGGMVTMLMYLKSDPGMWSGLILSAPLFVLLEKSTPSKLHLTLYGLLCGLADTWAVMPDPRAGAKSVRDTEKHKMIEMNPKLYRGKPRVGTMREVVRVTNYLQKNFERVTVPFFVAHGTLDGLASYRGSEMLYEKAATATEEKCLKLYEGMYHSLINGEPDEAAERVLADMKAWIDEKAEKFGPKVVGN